MHCTECGRAIFTSMFRWYLCPVSSFMQDKLVLSFLHLVLSSFWTASFSRVTLCLHQSWLRSHNLDTYYLKQSRCRATVKKIRLVAHDSGAEYWSLHRKQYTKPTCRFRNTMETTYALHCNRPILVAKNIYRKVVKWHFG